MKKILLMSLVFMTFMGVVSASSKNGDYEGNPIVKIMNYGNLLDPGDVPAILYNGRTMVPLGVLKKLGADIVWDQEKYSVNISFPTKYETITLPSDNAQIINDVKIANMYKVMQDLSVRLSEHPDFIDLYINSYLNHSSVTKKDSDLNDRISEIIDHYNSVSKQFNNLSELLTDPIANDLFNTLQNDYDSIDKYKIAITDIIEWKKYYVNGDNNGASQIFDRYLEDSNDGFLLANKAWTASSTGYNTYISKIIN